MNLHPEEKNKVDKNQFGGIKSLVKTLYVVQLCIHGV